MHNRERMNIVITGHVDHGKSTIIGKLLVDTNSLPNGKLETVKRNCENNSRPFEYAFLLDALKDEQSQGITIDSARVFFKTAKRDYIIIDAPGHVEFLKNMISGASRAEAALIVIDAEEGIKENSKRHGYMLSMLGIKQIVVLVNKMDLVNFDESIYDKIKNEFTSFLNSISVYPVCFIPVCGRNGDNIAIKSNKMAWYADNTVLDVLDKFNKEKSNLEKPFRMPVQAVYKFTEDGDTRRIIAGTVESGKAKCGDEVIFSPSGKKSKIKTIEGFNITPLTEIKQGMAVGFTLEEQIYISRGQMASIAGELPPKMGKNLVVNLFWLGKNPLIIGKKYLFKSATTKVKASLIEIQKVIDASDLSFTNNQDYIKRHDIAECILSLEKPAAFDLYENLLLTSRFVLVDDYEICGGGIIKSLLPDEMSGMREKIFARNYKWEKGLISADERAIKYGQAQQLIIITGEIGSGKKTIAKLVEEKLFKTGRLVYFLGIGNVKHGIDSDLDKQEKNRAEHLRRTAEVANILLDAGCILIVTARSLTNYDLEIFKLAVNPDFISVVWTGAEITTDIDYNLSIPGITDVEYSVNAVIDFIAAK